MISSFTVTFSFSCLILRRSLFPFSFFLSSLQHTFEFPFPLCFVILACVCSSLFHSSRRIVANLSNLLLFLLHILQISISKMFTCTMLDDFWLVILPRFTVCCLRSFVDFDDIFSWNNFIDI